MYSRILLIIFLIIAICIFLIYNYYNLSSSSFSYFLYQISKISNSIQLTINECRSSSSINNETYSYLLSRNKTYEYLLKPLQISNNRTINFSLSSDYIHFIRDHQTKSYPYSTWKCTKTSSVQNTNPDEYCILTNIYYKSSTDQYYFFRSRSGSNKQLTRDTFTTSYGPLKLQVTNNIRVIKNLHYSSKLIRPILVTHPPDANYAHGFLETCGPRFWALAECQSHPSYIDIKKVQMYFTSSVLSSYPDNWNRYRRQSDGTYVPIRKWEYQLHAMFSIYPLLTYKSFNQTTVLFEHLIFTGLYSGRTPIWAHHYGGRLVDLYPFPTVHYQRAYLAFSEWILYNFNLKSKFQFTFIQEPSNPTNDLDEYQGEWIVVVNRAGVGRREITNADELVQGLLQAFPNHSNSHLRVWPKQFNFDENLYETARIARSIRLLIGVHGAGLSNTLFMRPGSILYEINSYGCRHLSFNFRRWAEVFFLHYALWIPTKGEDGKQDEKCNFDGRTTVNIKEIIDEVKNLLANEIEYRDGYIKRALKVLNDTSIVDHPPIGYSNIL